MYRDLLVAFGGSSLLMVCVAFIVRSIIKHFLSKDIERYKLELKSQTDKAIFEHSSKFSNVYTKQAEIIAHLSQLLIPLRGALNIISNNLKKRRKKDLAFELTNEECARLFDAVMAIDEYFVNNEFYLPVELAEKIRLSLVKTLAICIKSNLSLTSLTSFDLSGLPHEMEEALTGQTKEQLLSNIPDLIQHFNEEIKDIHLIFREIVGIK